MSRTKKIFQNMIIIVILGFFILTWSGLFLSPLSAYRISERSKNYGPSKVIHIEDFENGKYILGKYDKWISCDEVNRVCLLFWRAGSIPFVENDKKKAVCYTWLSSHQNFMAYGIVNDNNINKIEVTLGNGTKLTQTKFYEDLFIIKWRNNLKKTPIFDALKGYDADNNIVFEE